MQKLIFKYEEFKKHLLNLKEYVVFNKQEKEANYRGYRDIVYGAIINRAYTLWETYIKDIFYEYFLLKEEDYLKDKTLIERYKINELPGYLFEEAMFNKEHGSIMFKLNREIISYTSKNMDMSEMVKLFKRVDIEIKNKLDSNKELSDAVSLFEISFEDGLLNENKITQGLKRLIQERNFVSHYAHIDEFQDLEILLEWINFYILLGKYLCKVICLEYAKSLDSNKFTIGKCNNALTHKKVLLIDIDNEIKIDKKTLIYVYRNNEIIDILLPISFYVEDKEVEFVQANDKAGIGVKTIFDFDTKINKDYKYYIMKNI